MIKDVLIKNGQEDIAKIYDKLSLEEKNVIENQVQKIDFKQLEELYLKVKLESSAKESIIEPISYIDKTKLKENKKEEYIKIGIEKISAGKLAAVTMAGGQGTRLGHNGPKGTYILDIEENKSLFQIICEVLQKEGKKYGVSIPWYIMTSKENNDDTVKFFMDNNFFGYNKNDIIFFEQEELPMLNKQGKLFLDENKKIKQAADGHGGVFKAIIDNGILKDMQKRKIEWVFVGGVDNCLVRMVDPLLIGICEEKNVLAAGKSLVKANPKEKVGVFCKKNGKPSVIEYTEISDEMAEKRDENGELVYGESHILCNMFNIKAIEQVGKEKLEYHVAFKKANYLDEDGKVVVATEPNSYKFESFIFDVFERLDDMVVLRVKREEEFAPVKNKEGVDSPETARALYYAQKQKENI